MRPVLLTLLMLALCWPLWLAAGWMSEMAAPAGAGLLMQAGLFILLLRLLEPLEARIPSSEEPARHD